MAADRFEHVLGTLDPSKRELIKKLVVGVAFAVPTVASYAVKDLAFAAVGSPGTTTTLFQTITTAATVTLTLTHTTVSTTTTTSTTTVTVTPPA